MEREQKYRLGEVVRIIGTTDYGYISGYVNGMYHVDLGHFLKFPAKEEWIEPYTPERKAVKAKRARAEAKKKNKKP